MLFESIFQRQLELAADADFFGHESSRIGTNATPLSSDEPFFVKIRVHSWLKLYDLFKCTNSTKLNCLYLGWSWRRGAGCSPNPKRFHSLRPSSSVFRIDICQLTSISP